MLTNNGSSEDEEKFYPVPTVEVAEERQKQHMRKWDMGVYIVIMALVLLTLGQALFSYRAQTEQNADLKAYVKCQGEWTTFLYQANVAGRGASQETAKAMDDLVFAIIEAKQPIEVRAALDKYKAAREAQSRSLEQNPLPPPPDQVCELDG